jgi:hypothetical protein
MFQNISVPRDGRSITRSGKHNATFVQTSQAADSRTHFQKIGNLNFYKSPKIIFICQAQYQFK